MFEIELRLLADQCFTLCRAVYSCQAAFLTVVVVKLEHIAKLLVIRRIAETHHRIAVHKDTVSLV